jgi:hypothetical protein
MQVFAYHLCQVDLVQVFTVQYGVVSVWAELRVYTGNSFEENPTWITCLFGPVSVLGSAMASIPSSTHVV